MEKGSDESAITLPEGMDEELLGKVLANPEMVALLLSLAKNLKRDGTIRSCFVSSGKSHYITDSMTNAAGAVIM